MPEQNLLDFTGIRYYDQWFKAHFPDKFATRADLEAVAALAASAYRFMGYVPSKDALPEDAAVGDVYAVGETGDQYAWTGEAWDKVTLDLHLENYVKKGEWVPQGGAMSWADKVKLWGPDGKPDRSPGDDNDGIAPYADRIAVDLEPDASVDGDDGALVGASLTIYVASVAGEEPAVGLASETASGSGSSTTVTFYMPRDSVPVGGSVTLEDAISPRLGADGAPAVKSARLEDASALEYTPGSGTKKTQGLRLDVEWQDGSGNADGPTDAFGTFDVEWSINATMGTVNMLLRWNYPSEKAYCSILFRRAGGLPIGIRQNIGKPGLGRSVMIKTDGMTSKELALSTVVVPAATSPLSGGRLDQNANGMTFDCATLDPINPLPAGQMQHSPYAQFRGVDVIDKTWRDAGQHGDVGDFRLVWQLAEPDRQAAPNTYIATFYWEQAGALKGRGMSFVLLSDTDAVGTSGRLWAFLPVRAGIAVPAGGSQLLSVAGVEIIAAGGHPLPEGMARAYLRSDSEALSFDGSVLTKAGDYRYFPEQSTSGVRLVWEDAAGNKHGPTDEYGTFSVCWTLAAVKKESDLPDAPEVSRTYAVDIAWCPNVLKVYHVLANYAAKLALDNRLSGANADRATAQKNGTMSGPDKEKLDSIEPGANRYIASEHVATDAALGLVKVDAVLSPTSVNPARNKAVHDGLAGLDEDVRGDLNAYISAAQEAIDGKLDIGVNADATQNGAMSKEAWTKLAGIEAGATKTIVDAAISDTSENPVQNKVIKAALDNIIDEDDLAKLMTVGTPQTASGQYTFTQPIDGDLAGNAATATKLQTARTIGVSGQMEGSAAFDGSDDAVIEASIPRAVPATALEDAGLVLGLDKNKKVAWIAPGSDTFLSRSGDQTVDTVKKFIDSPLVPEPLTADDGLLVPEIYVKDMLRARIEHESGGRNTVVRDKNGAPHHMVVFPKMTLGDLDPSGAWGIWEGVEASDVHPAFTVYGKEVPEILVGKYLASGNAVDQLQTLPGRVPYIINGTSVPTSLDIKESLGANFAVNTNANWGLMSLLALRMRGLDTVFDGNTDYGRSHEKPWQTGVVVNGGTPGDPNNIGITLTGSGPVEWSSDGTEWGVFDIVGNMQEDTRGMNRYTRNVTLIPDNNAMIQQSTTSAGDFVGLDANGGLTDSSNHVTLAYSSGWKYMKNTQGSTPANGKFSSITYDNANVSELAMRVLRRLALAPISKIGDGVEGGFFFANLSGVYRPLYRGGAWRPVDVQNDDPIIRGLFSIYWGGQNNLNCGLRLAYLP